MKFECKNLYEAINACKRIKKVNKANYPNTIRVKGDKIEIIIDGPIMEPLV